MFGLELTTLRLDKLSLVFATIFLIAAFLGALYALYEDDPLQQVAGTLYAGSAVGGVLAGDLVTLFLFWEGTAITSVVLIWARGTERAYRAGMRYLIFQIGSGVILLTGILLQYHATKILAFDQLGTGYVQTWSLAVALIFVAFAIKGAFPLVHTWLSDAYPEATASGTVLLSAFTTKLAIYALARGYAGTDVMVPIGAVMALFPIALALIENDLRRVIAYGLISQLGVMVIGIGIGSSLGVNGAVAHAVTGVLYVALLYMGIGAVLVRTGTAKASELGGISRSMPVTMILTVLGAASLAAVPLFAGFASKALIAQAALDREMEWVWLVLLAASAGGTMAIAVRVPFAAFFTRDNRMRPAEAPAPMLAAMTMTALLGFAIGVWPEPLYRLLPNQFTYKLLTFDHVVTQLQLVVFSTLAFALLRRLKLFPKSERAINLDSDWFYRRLGSYILRLANTAAEAVWGALSGAFVAASRAIGGEIKRAHNPVSGVLGRSWTTGVMAFWTAVLLGGYLILFYLNRGVW